MKMPRTNWTLFCGEADVTIWKNDDFGPCFKQMAIECPVFACLAIVSVYYLGNRVLHLSRSRSHLHLLTGRKLIALCQLLCPLVKVLIVTFRYRRFRPLPLMDYVSLSVQVVSWLLHIYYLFVLRKRITVHSRGPKLTMFGWLLTAVVSALSVRTYLISYPIGPNRELEYVTYTQACLHVLYFCTLIPKGQARETVPRRRLLDMSDGVRQPLVADSFSESYGAVTGHAISTGILETEDAAGLFSKFTFGWVNQLLLRGDRQQLNAVEDVFELPGRLETTFLDTKFWIVFRDLQLKKSIVAEERRLKSGKERSVVEPVSILRALVSSFGREYFALGLLKLFTDGAAFVGPIVLNMLVQYIEQGSINKSIGYYYVLALLGTGFLSALCSSQYSYHLRNVGLKVRASVISTIYRKTLHLRSSSMANYSIGEIVNFMSTDTERVVNMCNSFHEFWSMPVMIAVCLYLLHQQVGLAYVAGIGFAVLLIPVNHCIAKTIGKLSVDMMSQKDKRVKIMTELLYGIRVIKLYSWEDYMWNKVQKLREAELKSLKKRKYLDAFCVFFWAITPVIIAVFTFSTCIWLGYELSIAKVFTCLALFNMLIVPLNAFPWVLGGMVQGFVSIKRVQKILQIPESNLTKCYSNLEESTNLAMYVRNGHFSWNRSSVDPNANRNNVLEVHAPGEQVESYQFRLEDVNFEAHKGQLIGIAGPVGCGKTSLLLALMAEMERHGGEIGSSCIADGFAYVSQEPWIQNATIRQNILFGKPLLLEKYYEVLNACALEEDLQSFPAGDDTWIGDRGINLSGGQKTRISLARAIYQDKDIYLMDDILSTVDVHVGQHLVDNCINGILKHKTRLLCTHHWKHLTKAHKILLMDEGRIVKQGKYEDVLHDLVRTSEKLTNAGNASDDSAYIEKDGQQAEGDIRSLGNERNPAEGTNELSERGTVKWKIYSAYARAIGPILTFVIMFSMCLMQSSRNLSDWWLAHWMSETTKNTSNFTLDEFGSYALEPKSGIQDYEFYLMVYGILAGIGGAVCLVRAFSFAFGGIRAAVHLHNNILKTILRASVRFFDVTPVGRIVNRFSSDTYVIDDDLPFVLNILLAQSFGLAGSLVIICYSMPWLLLVLVPLGAIYFQIQSFYRHSSRDVRRLEAITLSPIYSHFSETVLGLTSIRAFRSEARFKKENEERLEKNQRAMFSLGAISAWLNLRLQMIGVAVVTGIATMAVLQHHLQGIDPGLVGLALSYGLSVTSVLRALVEFWTETEKQLVSVERTVQYIESVESERWEGFIKPPSFWPDNGVVAFHSVMLRYRANLPLALKGVTFRTNPGEKLGIVGRTGAGKSSLFAALFRLVEVEKGGITVDGQVLAYLDLKDLRANITMIPQDPFLISGTVRENLTSSNEIKNDDLWSALHQCHLAETVERIGGLDGDLGERGGTLSMGQRQLLCLCRAVLTKPRVLCIDEATANIDHETDRLLQQTIRNTFKDTTVLTVAHRLETVMDSDRILVMDQGTVVEIDSPKNLLASPTSHFYQLVQRHEWAN